MEAIQEETWEGIISYLIGIPRYHTLRVRGTIQGQKAIVMIDDGASHNFIDVEFVGRRGLTNEEFGGFTILILVKKEHNHIP